MEQELIKLGLQGGVAVSVLIALYFVLSKIAEIVKNRNGGDLNKKIKEIEENHLTEINERLARLEESMVNIRERVAKLEVEIRSRNYKINVR